MRWVTRFDGEEESHDYCFRIALDSLNNIYVSGGTDDTSGYDYGTIKYVQVPGVEENRSPLSADGLSFEVYPNPAKTYFTIHFLHVTDRTQIKIFDVTGNIIKQAMCKKQEMKISLDGIKNGVYFVQVGDKSKTNKLIITK